MSKLNMGDLTVNDAREGEVNLPMATAGAIGGALAMGVIYGVVGASSASTPTSRS